MTVSARRFAHRGVGFGARMRAFRGLISVRDELRIGACLVGAIVAHPSLSSEVVPQPDAVVGSVVHSPKIKGDC